MLKTYEYKQEGNLVNFNWSMKEEYQYNIYDEEFNTFNILAGIKPVDNLTLMAERRYTRGSTTFLLGTVDYSFMDGTAVTDVYQKTQKTQKYVF